MTKFTQINALILANKTSRHQIKLMRASIRTSYERVRDSKAACLGDQVQPYVGSSVNSNYFNYCKYTI